MSLDDAINNTNLPEPAHQIEGKNSDDKCSVAQHRKIDESENGKGYEEQGLHDLALA